MTINPVIKKSIEAALEDDVNASTPNLSVYNYGHNNRFTVSRSNILPQQGWTVTDGEDVIGENLANRVAAAECIAQFLAGIDAQLEAERPQREREMFALRVMQDINQGRGAVHAFANRLLVHGDATHELSRADDVMEAAARYRVGEGVIALLRGSEQHPTPMTITQVREWLLERVLEEARFPTHSTSQSTNVVARYKAAAAARFLERMESIVDGDIDWARVESQMK